MIEAKSLCKSFGEVVAADAVSFHAEDGKITGILGPNGAGKSTTLRMLYTAFQADSGTALINGYDIHTQQTEVRASIGVLTHNAGIYERLTGEENIAYFGKLHGMSRADIDKNIADLSDMLEMDAFIQRRCKGFSQGQRTKVALARALVHRPKNVILDEPTNGLDIVATRGLRKAILRLKEQGHCVLFSSHIMQEVSALCDDIVIINQGKVTATGSPDTLLERTQTRNLEDAFVQLIGSEEGLI